MLKLETDINGILTKIGTQYHSKVHILDLQDTIATTFYKNEN